MEQDAWSAELATTRTRWQAAAAVDALLRERGHPARVTCTPAGWAVRSGTGAVVLAGTATALWAAVRAVRPLPDGALDGLEAAAVTAPVRAVARAGAAGRPGHRTSA